MNKRIRTPRMPNPERREIALGFKVNKKEHIALQQLANKYADGNISAFVRHVALDYKAKGET